MFFTLAGRSMKFVNRKKCRRINTPGDAHALTFSCFQRRAFFTKDRTRQWLLDAINIARSKHHFDLWAFVIMPEHVHLLILPREKIYSISKILSTIKQSVAKKAIAYLRKHNPDYLQKLADISPDGEIVYRYWQRGGGYDRNLWEAKAIWAEIDYIHMNPVKRKLCIKPTEWQWSSAAEFELPGSGPLRMNRESLPRLFA